MNAALPVDLETVSVHWRLALDAAQDAVKAAGGCGTTLGLPAAELGERARRLADEREATARLLELIAADEHVQLRHHLSAPRATRRMLGLPDSVLACVFDLDGVLTASAAVHAAAWAEALDEFLSRRVERTGERFAPYRPFNPRNDYDEHIDGKPRLDGVHAFLASRGIRLPVGRPGDPPGAETVHGLANRKNEALLRRLDREGVAAYADSRLYLEAAREAGLVLAVVSPSSNTATILERAGLDDLVAEIVDGNIIRDERLRSKPAPDTLLAACRRIGVLPEHAAAFETTAAGIAAARAAEIGFLVAVERGAPAASLHANGGGLVVGDLAALLEER